MKNCAKIKDKGNLLLWMDRLSGRQFFPEYPVSSLSLFAIHTIIFLHVYQMSSRLSRLFLVLSMHTLGAGLISPLSCPKLAAYHLYLFPALHNPTLNILSLIVPHSSAENWTGGKKWFEQRAQEQDTSQLWRD